MKRIMTIVLILLSATAALVTVVLSVDYLSQREKAERDAFAAAKTQAEEAAEEINTAFGDLVRIADDLAADLSTGDLAYGEVETRLVGTLTDRSDINGIAVTFAPFAYDPDRRLFQIYVYRNENEELQSLVGASYDYTGLTGTASADDVAWYVDTINEGAQWHEPFRAVGAQETLVEYGVPFYQTDVSGEGQAVAGIVAIDYTLDDVLDLMRQLELGATGYGYVLTDKGTYLAHPIAGYVADRTIFDDSADNESIVQAQEHAINSGTRDFIEINDPITGETTWEFFEPIASTGWTIGIVMYEDQFLPEGEQTIRDQMKIAVTFAGFLFLVATTIYHVDDFRFTNFWFVSGTFSALCSSLIVLAWALTNQVDALSGVSITSQTQLDRYLQGVELSLDSQQVPTGIEIQAIRFPDATSVVVNGYVWQRYAEGSTVTPGIVLPDRIGEQATLEELQRETINGENLIIWYFGMTLRQGHDSTRFPFDHRTITIRILPQAIGENVVLTPDLESYSLINPSALPGISDQVRITDWQLQSSRFSYMARNQSTSYGRPEFADEVSSPELRFEIQVQRLYIGPFIAYLLPGAIAAVLTFAYLVTRHEPGRNEESINALNFAAALFFVVALIHTALRDRIAAIGITYMEHVFILLYLAIIAVAANIFVVARYPDWWIVRCRDNLLPKVLYWPVFSGAMLLSTLAVFVF